MRRLQTFCAPFIVLVGLSTELCWAMLPAKDLSANLTIQPSAPTKSWPAANESNALAPNYTATISVNAVATEKIGNINYRLTSGPTVKTTRTDPNILWTKATDSNNFSITNTAANTAAASISLSCVWSSQIQQAAPNGKGSGRGGSGPRRIAGTADANVQLLDSAVDWVFDRPAQWADGSKPIKFEVTLTDSNGFGLERWSLTEFAASAASPATPGWAFTYTPAIGSSQSGEIKSNTPSKGKVQIKYNDGSVEARLSTQELAFIKLKLVKVEFSGSGNRDILSDDSNTNYDASHWSDPNGDGDPADGNAYPVAYVSDTKLTISPEWQIEPVVDGVSLKIKATGPDSISVSEVNASVSGNDVKLATAAAATNVFEKDKVRYWDKFGLNFEASFQGENEWTAVGESKNQLYVTRGTPAVSPLFHTVVHLGCSNADGKTSKADIVSAIWSNFSNRNVRRVGSSSPMQYWGANAAGIGTTASLLAVGDGQCAAWGRLLVDILASQDITSTYTLITPDTSQIFSGTSLPALALRVDPSLPGQGPAAPQNQFFDHIVVRYGGTIYDPSYGKIYATELQWEDASLTDFIYSNPAVLTWPDTKGTQQTKFTP